MGGYFGPDRTGNVAGKTLHIHFYLNDGDGDYYDDYESNSIVIVIVIFVIGDDSSSSLSSLIPFS